ncbi:hypothetical protein EIP86_004363 [Pleurotus ostreatoroseus]|nr:hypothetical protein EIP86_004363 [Pleurotus ostreatoroseus]
MHFSTILASLAAVGVAAAQTTVHNITVGDGGNLTFTPNSITASENDVVMFTFVTKNHTATQSTFTDPCTPVANGTDSDFQFVATNDTTGPFPTFNYTVTNASAPLWFFCRQTNPVDHCQKGMVFAINAPDSGNKTFGAFQQAAMATNATSSSNSTGNSTSTGSSSSTSASGTTPPAPSNSSPAGALRVGATGALLGGVGLLALAF